jgi:hypothetical protein
VPSVRALGASFGRSERPATARGSRASERAAWEYCSVSVCGAGGNRFGNGQKRSACVPVRCNVSVVSVNS